MKIKLNRVRLSFPSLFTAKAGMSDPKTGAAGSPKFSASFLIDPATPNGAALIAEINAAIDTVAKEKWGAKSATVVTGLRAQDRVAIHDGATKANFEGYAGSVFVASSSSTRPLVIDRDRTPLSEEDGRIYAGCYVNATVELWAQDNQFGKRINAQTLAVQFVTDGDAFSAGGVGSAEDFDDLAGEDLSADSLV